MQSTKQFTGNNRRKMKKDIQTPFESAREAKTQIAIYKQPQTMAAVPMIAAEEETAASTGDDAERLELVDFIILNRGYERENIPQEKARLLKIYSLSLLRE